MSYATRLHMLIFQTYIFSIVALVINYYLWCIEFAKKELGIANNKKKTLLADSQALAKRLKSFDLKEAPAKDRASAQKVIVLPEGIHKPAAPAAPAVPAVPAAPAAPAEPRKQAMLEGPDEGWASAKDLSGAAGAAKDSQAEDKKAGDVAPAAADKDVVEAEADKAGPAGAGAKVAPEPSKASKSEADGAFKNEEGVFHDVLELLDSDEVWRGRRIT